MTILYSRVIFEKNGKYLSAKVVHNSGRTLISASTSEEAYRSQSDRFVYKRNAFKKRPGYRRLARRNVSAVS